MIYLMRHGQDNEDFVGGWSDVDLISTGILEVNEAALWLKDNLSIKRIISSDVKRAMTTAEIVAKILDVPFTVDANLREQNKGILNGRKVESLTSAEKQLIMSPKLDTLYPNGETFINFHNRIKKHLEKLKTLEDDVLIVTHRGVINNIYFILNNVGLDMNKKRFNVTTASIHELDKDSSRIRRIY